jgi:hypothetical protein
MNEQIKELAEQANKYALGNWTDTYNNLYNEKFAELIIKECGRELESYDPDFDWATVALKKHFGVE